VELKGRERSLHVGLDRKFRSKWAGSDTWWRRLDYCGCGLVFQSYFLRSMVVFYYFLWDI
jgi:hypothetical protein